MVDINPQHIGSEYPCTDCGRTPRDCQCDLSKPKSIRLFYWEPRPGICNEVWLKIESNLASPDAGISLNIGTGMSLRPEDIQKLVPTITAWSERLLAHLSLDDHAIAVAMREVEPFKTVIAERQKTPPTGCPTIARMLNERWDVMRKTQEGRAACWIEMKRMGLGLEKIFGWINDERAFPCNAPLNDDYVKKGLARLKVFEHLKPPPAD